MPAPWIEEDWSKGILLGLRADPNSGYRATVWFEYTRYLFNEIREGSLIAIRNFSDRSRNFDGSPVGQRNASYEEYSILQIDQVHPWHYAIQGGGEQGYPGFTVAAAESARTDWTTMDEENRDDVSRIKCEAIPLRLGFRLERNSDQLPGTFPDRSMPMPGFEARLLSPPMVEAVLNKGVEDEQAFEIGRHIVQYEVPIYVRREELLRLHFGVFGYTGAGKSNLVSSLVDNILANGQQPQNRGERAFKVVLIDLMDEYTGLMIDHLVRHRYSRLVVCGRRTLSAQVFQACLAASQRRQDAQGLVVNAARDWARRLILPSELKPLNNQYENGLSQLILDGKIKFYETLQEQGLEFNLEWATISDAIGPGAYADVRAEPNYRQIRDRNVEALRNEIDPLINQARNVEGQLRDALLQNIIERLQNEIQQIIARNSRDPLQAIINDLRNNQMGARGTLPDEIAINPNELVNLIDYQPQPTRPNQFYYPSLTVIIGENETAIANFVRQLVEANFENRRVRSILYPTTSYIFDEADVFISGQRQRENTANLVEPATTLARRGRKFGLGIGIATQRVRFLDTSIMAQPHTYFISKLPRKSDREVVAQAFAISDETLEQTFGFTVGQWLITSHDATGLKGVPFPVQLPNANQRIVTWLESNQS